MTWGYYAYVIGNDGHIQNRVDVVCDNDEDAKRCAQQLAHAHAIELWQETRMVATVQPERPQARLPGDVPNSDPIT